MADVTIFYASSQEGNGMSRSLLYQAAQIYTGLNREQLGPLETNPWGKPSFSLHPDVYFSVTHSKEWWLCAFSRHPVGLDLQFHHSYAPPSVLSQRFFHPMEDRFLARENYRHFFDLWCAKESWVKFLGKGFFEAPETFSVVSQEGDFPAMSGAWLQLLPFQANYSLCLCSKEPTSVQFFFFPL